MSIDLVFRGMMVALDTPTAVELSHWMGDLCCGNPISVRDWRSGTMALAQMKRPASSASAAEDMTFFVSTHPYRESSELCNEVRADEVSRVPLF